MSIKSILDEVLRREGGYVDNPADKGGRTNYGISERSHPEAWKDGKVTEDEARAIYLKKYVEGPGFDLIADERLMAQLVDFGVNSGPMVAIKKLQEIIHVEQDGVIGPETLGALEAYDPRLVNNQLVAARIKMIGRIVQKNPSQVQFLSGWLNRSLEFLA